jgi:hypothetical protein
LLGLKVMLNHGDIGILHVGPNVINEDQILSEPATLRDTNYEL